MQHWYKHKEKRFEWSVHRYNAKMLNTEVQEQLELPTIIVKISECGLAETIGLILIFVNLKLSNLKINVT